MKAKIPELSTVGSKLNSIVWTGALAKDEELKFRRAFSKKSRHVVLLGPSWMVTVSFSSRIFTLATVNINTPNAAQVAARYSDMAQMFFWRYRKRRCRPPTDAELNISAERALRDLKEETAVVDLLREQEKILLDGGYINPIPAVLEKEKRQVGATQRAISDMSVRLVNTQSRLTDFETQFKQLVDAVAAQAKSIEGVGTVIATRLDGQLSMLGDTSKRLDSLLAAQHGHAQGTGDLAKRLTDIQAQQGTIITILQKVVERISEARYTASSVNSNSGVASSQSGVLGSCKLNT